jgi:hypothetical protein
MLDRAAAVLRVILASFNWACWLGQHHWQGWFELKVCIRCQQVGWRPSVRR